MSGTELSILESRCLRPIMRNSVLEELRVRRFADIQEEMCLRAVWRWAILEMQHSTTLPTLTSHDSSKVTSSHTAAATVVTEAVTRMMSSHCILRSWLPTSFCSLRPNVASFKDNGQRFCTF